MTYRVIIPTAGIGSRLQKLTENLNKSLVSIANKPILSHLINQFPITTEFVIALGYKGQLVRDFLELAYPERKFFFVNVNPYKGRGSGLGFSLWSCKKFLQQPFVFISCDTIVKEKIPAPNINWIGFSNLPKSKNFRTLEISNNQLIKINEKKIKPPSSSKNYIGLAGIHDYSSFWKNLERFNKQAIFEGEVYGIKNILEKKKIKSLPFSWFDVGNTKTLNVARKHFLDKKKNLNILEKNNESIWFVNKKVIKFSIDKKFILSRFKRSKILNGYVPKINKCKENMYSYNEINGKVFSSTVNLKLFKSLLNFSDKFWKKQKLNNDKKKLFQKQCKRFYYDKTLERINLFYKKFSKIDQSEKINGEKIPKLASLLKKIDWKDILDGTPGQFHGDYHFENILFLPSYKKFIFLDWRQDFAGNLKVGDIYYDLAKLLHGLIVSHESIVNNRFSIKWDKKKIKYKMLLKAKMKKNCIIICNFTFLSFNISLIR